MPLDVVREVAALLRANGLGEIALESTNEQNPLRLKIERETFVAAPAIVVATAADVAEVGSEIEASEEETALALSEEAREIGAPCVGVYRGPKKALAVGDVVRSGQVIGVVESLRVPNEVVAPFNGRVLELPVVEGQGIEWGQTLLVLEPTL